MKAQYRQVIEQESQDTNINIDYYDRNIRIYTSKANVMNRLTRLWYIPSQIDKFNGKVSSMSFEFDTKDIGKFLRTSIFKYD